MNKFIKDMFTVANGEDYDIGRVLWALAFIIGIGLCISGFCMSRPFDLQAYGIGVGALLAGGGGALMLKNKTEPQ